MSINVETKPFPLPADSRRAIHPSAAFHAAADFPIQNQRSTLPVEKFPFTVPKAILSTY